MKKSFLLILLALILACTLVACVDPKNDDEGKTTDETTEAGDVNDPTSGSDEAEDPTDETTTEEEPTGGMQVGDDIATGYGPMTPMQPG